MDLNLIDGLYKKSKFVNKSRNYHFLFVSKNGFTSSAIKKMESIKAIYLDLADIEDLFNKAT